VALHLFSAYCRCRRLDHPEISKYIEHMWGFMALRDDVEGFEKWEFGRPDLVDAGLGYDLPTGLEAHLAAHGVPESEFRSALMYATEVLYSSLWGAADDKGSLRYIETLASIALAAGATWPDLSAFAYSRWVDGAWGGRLSAEQLARWRAAG
jgi:hypothetical protein